LRTAEECPDLTEAARYYRRSVDDVYFEIQWDHEHCLEHGKAISVDLSEAAK
jgi:TPR repeat protein